MPRVKTGPTRRRRHKKMLKLAKGYVGGRRRLFRSAKETVMRAGNYAYAHRRLRKRDFRRLWIARINAAARMYGLNYSRLMGALRKAEITLNRKMLAEMAVSDPEGFKSVIEQAGLTAS
ncbi:MAG: 50S ribosomal protein L20 [candidate division WS1 bacterium]|jgi:large subunit ribosomal protein L20|nr:50S ribosomal protein L20 [candidate division WS1 bacterium]